MTAPAPTDAELRAMIAAIDNLELATRSGSKSEYEAALDAYEEEIENRPVRLSDALKELAAFRGGMMVRP